MKLVNECYAKVKKNCFKYIKSQETNTNKFKNKDRMLKSYLIPLCFWISEKTNKKKTTYNRFVRWSRNRKNYNYIDSIIDIKKIF